MGNHVRFRLSPQVGIALGARAKEPGEGMVGRPVELSVLEGAEQGKNGRMDAYERLLGDAMAGDATLFARQDVVEAAWAIVDPVLNAAGPLHIYEPGSWGPPESEALTAGVGGWNTPDALDAALRERYAAAAASLAPPATPAESGTAGGRS